MTLLSDCGIAQQSPKNTRRWNCAVSASEFFLQGPWGVAPG